MARMSPKKDWKPLVIAGVASGLTVTHAAKQAGVARQQVYLESDKDPEFADAMRKAFQEAADHLEAEARRRAVEGVERKKFHKGKPIRDPRTHRQYVEREYSDTLLIFLLKGRRPEVFGDKVQLTHDGTLRTTTDVTAAADALLDRVAKRLGARSGGAAGDAANP
jgi:hypothetical protein